MTTPALAFPVRGRGRHYPYKPCDPSGWPRNRWQSVDLDDIPDTVDPLPSVTNVLSIIDKPALKHWSARMALTELYDADQFPADLDTAVKNHAGAYARQARKRADIGTKAHTVAEALTSDLPLPSSLSDEDEQFADAFLAWWSDTDPEPIVTEATVLDVERRYGGTADLFAIVDGIPTVVDYKTRGSGKPGVYQETWLQLAALASASEVATRTAGGWEVTPQSFRMDGMCVVLFPDGTYQAERVSADDIEGRWFPGFVAARVLWETLKGGNA